MHTHININVQIPTYVDKHVCVNMYIVRARRSQARFRVA